VERIEIQVNAIAMKLDLLLTLVTKLEEGQSALREKLDAVVEKLDQWSEGDDLEEA
jgi:hypothetical protein